MSTQPQIEEAVSLEDRRGGPTCEKQQLTHEWHNWHEGQAEGAQLLPVWITDFHRDNDI